MNYSYLFLNSAIPPPRIIPSSFPTNNRKSGYFRTRELQKKHRHLSQHPGRCLRFISRSSGQIATTPVQKSIYSTYPSPTFHTLYFHPAQKFGSQRTSRWVVPPPPQPTYFYVSPPKCCRDFKIKKKNHIEN